ncbi:MAG: hypothetical protein LBQ24_00915 [Candidatus Peribacteria bacterium]|nr:hypothetical protein [Candidatus Peribacteria bacterium]
MSIPFHLNSRSFSSDFINSSLIQRDLLASSLQVFSCSSSHFCHISIILSIVSSISPCMSSIASSVVSLISSTAVIYTSFSSSIFSTLFSKISFMFSSASFSASSFFSISSIDFSSNSTSVALSLNFLSSASE